MKFENRGRWLKEAQDKMAARDTMEDPDFLDGDDKVLTFEEEELDMEDDDNFEDVEEETIEESAQKNEAVTKASKQLLSWAKLPQVKAAIAKADEKTFRKLMEEFTKSIGSTEDFPMTSTKNGKLVFALTDTPITIDSLVKEWFDDRYLFESAQKNEGVHFGQPDVDKCYSELMDISFQEMKKRHGKELTDKEFEAFRPILLKKYPKEVVDYCYIKANESAQKNEAKLDRDSEINFDNVGCGFEVSKMAIAGGYALYCSGFSNNTSKNLAFAHKDLSMDTGLTQEQRKANYDALQKAKVTIAKELKPLADKFDRDVAAVFAKHGFKPHKD